MSLFCVKTRAMDRSTFPYKFDDDSKYFNIPLKPSKTTISDKIANLETTQLRAVGVLFG